MECIKCGMEMKKVNLFGLPGVNMTLSQGVPNWRVWKSAVLCAAMSVPAAAMWNCRPLNLTNSGKFLPTDQKENTYEVKAWLNSRR